MRLHTSVPMQLKGSGADGGGWMRRGCGRIWAEGAGGIKSGARGWGEALAGENGWLRMPVYVGAPGFNAVCGCLYQGFI